MSEIIFKNKIFYNVDRNYFGIVLSNGKEKIYQISEKNKKWLRRYKSYRWFFSKQRERDCSTQEKNKKIVYFSKIGFGFNLTEFINRIERTR